MNINASLNAALLLLINLVAYTLLQPEISWLPSIAKTADLNYWVLFLFVLFIFINDFVVENLYQSFQGHQWNEHAIGNIFKAVGMMIASVYFGNMLEEYFTFGALSLSVTYYLVVIGIFRYTRLPLLNKYLLSLILIFGGLLLLLLTILKEFQRVR